MKNRFKLVGTAITAAMCLLESASSYAADQDEDQWVFTSPTFVWLSGIDGDVTARGRTVDVELDFADISEHTDIGFQMYVEGRKGRFGFYLNPSYLHLGADGKTGPVKLDFEQSLWIVEVGGIYRVGEWCEDRPLTLDAFAGLRYWGIDTDVKLTGVPVIGTVKTDGSTDLFDPIIGARARKYLTDKLWASLRVDVGGFNISDDSTSKFTWQAMPLIGYDFNKYFTLAGGYRALAIDHDEGSGAKEKGFDLIMHGVMIGFDFDIFGWLADRR